MCFCLFTSEYWTVDIDLGKQKETSLDKYPADKSTSPFILKFLNSLNFFFNIFSYRKKNYIDFLLFRYFVIVNTKNVFRNVIFQNFTAFLLFTLYLKLYSSKTLQTLIMQFYKFFLNIYRLVFSEKKLHHQF